MINVHNCPCIQLYGVCHCMDHTRPASAKCPVTTALFYDRERDMIEAREIKCIVNHAAVNSNTAQILHQLYATSTLPPPRLLAKLLEQDVFMNKAVASYVQKILESKMCGGGRKADFVIESCCGAGRAFAVEELMRLIPIGAANMWMSGF